MYLVTGGGGFIGSHLVDTLVKRGERVRVLDDYSTGRRENLADTSAEVIEGDITDFETCLRAVDGVKVVLHEAAARAVGLSVSDPVTSDRVNTGGTVKLLTACRDRGVRRVIIASSSSVYGGTAPLPTSESAPVNPRSPYAVSKVSSEHYLRVFHELFGLEALALRYFNVYGPRQHPDSPYAAAIPLFVRALLKGEAPTVFGDGLQTRDFTFIDDVVAANLAAADTADAHGQVYNIAGGNSYTILEIIDALQGLLGTAADPVIADPRPGDVRASQADPSAAAADLGWRAKIQLDEGLSRTVEWIRNEGR